MRKTKKTFILLRFTTNLLINHYTHIGLKKNFTNTSYAKALLGFYSGVGIINPNLTMLGLKMCIRFLFSILIQNKKFCLVAFNFPSVPKRNLGFHGNYFIFNNWPSGLVSNEITTIFSSRIRKKNSYYPNTPTSFVTLDVETSKLFSIIKEANTFCIPVFSFADSNMDLDVLNYWIPSNLKNHKTILFWFALLKKLIFKSVIRRKVLFRSAAAKDRLNFFSELVQKKEILRWVRGKRVKISSGHRRKWGRKEFNKKWRILLKKKTKRNFLKRKTKKKNAKK